jgi:hypothetical protein
MGHKMMYSIFPVELRGLPFKTKIEMKASKNERDIHK